MRRILLVILALALISTPALAGTCTLRGTVTDADGNPVEGAQVTLFDANRAEVTTVDTDAGGHFAFIGARVDTGDCTVRVFYNDLHRTYNNAAYFTEWYPATGDRSIPEKDTRLETLHLSASPSSAPRAPLTPGLSAAATVLALMAGAAMGAPWKKHG
ncbi:MAG TPA: carboxypeptidase-like regulatory domain-containing protein [Methanocella sp.]|nr:carboxypeptidase-like regulatory domain-containing protein [Methanocella sp.]